MITAVPVAHRRVRLTRRCGLLAVAVGLAATDLAVKAVSYTHLTLPTTPYV